MDDEASRRRVLAACAGALSAGVAGCNVEQSRDRRTGERTEPPGGADERDLDREGLPDERTPGPVAESVADRFVDAYDDTIGSVAQLQVFGSRGRGQGTGWVYDDEFVVTNQHVVGSASDVYARFPEGGWTEASVVGTDVYSDLAVLLVEEQPASATPLALADSDPAVGREVVAIGNPFGLSGSVTAGIVSGVDRTLPAPNDFSIPDAIQTDAPVNPGNSGGPLVDLDGTVVGVVNSGGGDNVGFAVSAALTRRVVPSLVDDGSYEHSYMGIRLRPVGPLLARANDVDRGRGVYVDSVVPDGPSRGVFEGSTGETTIEGVEVPTGGDVIVAMENTPIPQRQALSAFLALETRPGDTIAVTVLRDGAEQTVDLTLGSRPDP
jgi:S1-C subfamily serine protease